ncbi:MAG: hypothetical protein RL653_331 [Pseudomonadota bacterium]
MDSFQRTNEAGPARRLGGAEALRRASSEFDKASARVKELNARLGTAVDELRALGRTPEEVARAVEGFKGAYAADFKRFDQASAALAALAPAAVRTLAERGSGAPAPARGMSAEGLARQAAAGAARGVLERLPQAMESRAAAERLGATLSSPAGDGMLQQLRSAAGNVAAGKGLLDKVATAAVQGLGTRAVVAAARGDADGARRALATLGTVGAKLNVDPAAFARASAGLDGVLTARSGTALSAAKRELLSGVGGLRANVGLANTFKGLGVALGGAGVLGGVAGWDEASGQQRLRTLAGAGELSAEAGSAALRFLGHADAAAGVAKAAAKRLPLVGAVLDGVDAFAAFKQGRVADGVSSSLLAAGPVVALLPVPGAQLVGIGMLAAGAGMQLYKKLFGGGKEGDEATEGALQLAFKSAGLPAHVARALDVLDKGQRVMGPFLQQLGGDTRAFVQGLARMPAKKLEAFSEMVRGLPRPGGQVPGRAWLRAGTDAARPASMEGARAWLRANGFVLP